MSAAYPREQVRLARTFLFVPGNRPERFRKAVAAQPDIVVIDLEDAVGADDKDTARGHLRDWLAAGYPAMTRVNAADTVWHDADITVAAEFGAPVMVAKAQQPDQLRRIADSGVAIVPLVETAAGIMAAQDLCVVSGVARLAFGSIDLAAELGIDPTDREALLQARSTLVLASAAAGLAPPIDGVTTALHDPQTVIDDVTYAKRIGLAAKLCIHPAQIPTVHAAVAPTSDQLAWAQKVLGASTTDGSALAVDGHLVDLPVIARARRIAATAQLDSP